MKVQLDRLAQLELLVTLQLDVLVAAAGLLVEGTDAVSHDDPHDRHEDHRIGIDPLVSTADPSKGTRVVLGAYFVQRSELFSINLCDYP